MTTLTELLAEIEGRANTFPVIESQKVLNLIAALKKCIEQRNGWIEEYKCGAASIIEKSNAELAAILRGDS